MDLDDFLGPKPNVIDLRAENRWEAIEELIDHLVKEKRIAAEHREAIAKLSGNGSRRWARGSVLDWVASRVNRLGVGSCRCDWTVAERSSI